MPVVKQYAARPAMKEAVVLDLGDIGAQAEKLRIAAEAKAQAILDTAQTKADTLAEGAEQKGHAQGLERGIAQGITQGQAEGKAQVLADLKPRLEEVAGAFMQVAAQWEDQRHQLHTEAKAAVLELALRLAEKVVHRVVELDRSVVTDHVAEALVYALAPTEVVVAVSPEDEPIVQEALPELVKSFANLQHATLETDANLAPGGCIIKFAEGQVDASIEKQLSRIVEAMLPADEADQADEPSSTPDVGITSKDEPGAAEGKA